MRSEADATYILSLARMYPASSFFLFTTLQGTTIVCVVSFSSAALLPELLAGASGLFSRILQRGVVAGSVLSAVFFFFFSLATFRTTRDRNPVSFSFFVLLRCRLFALFAVA